MSKKIRSLIFLLFLMMLSMITYPAVKTPSEVTFDGEVYKQAYQDGDGVKTNRVTEYLRKGENHDNYAKMIAIWEYPEVKDLEGFTGNLIKDHKKNYPTLQREVIVKNDGSESLVNFVMAEGNITEFDIFRLLKRDGHVTAYQYTNRNYSPTKTSDNTKWWNDLKQNKNKWVDLMTKVNYVK